jgi:hypothetical protein
MEVTLHNGERMECERVVNMAWDRPDEEVDRRTRALLAKHPGRSYVEAMHIILAEDEGLKRAYAQQPFKVGRVARQPSVRFSDGTQLDRVSFRTDADTPGDQIHAKVQRLRAQDSALSYADAYRQVLDDPENAALKQAYAKAGR